jgi:hypothetical protein
MRLQPFSISNIKLQREHFLVTASVSWSCLKMGSDNTLEIHTIFSLHVLPVPRTFVPYACHPNQCHKACKTLMITINWKNFLPTKLSAAFLAIKNFVYFLCDIDNHHIVAVFAPE